MKPIVLLPLAAAFLASACVSTKATVLDHSVVRDAVAAEQVRIYRDASQVRGNYTEIALLNSRGDSLTTNERGMMESMRKKAAKLGANGVIMDAMTEPHAAIQVVAAVLNTGTSRRGKAVAIFVHPQGSAEAAIAQPVAAPEAAAPAMVAANTVVVAPAPAAAPAAAPTVIIQQAAPRSFLSDYSGVAAPAAPPGRSKRVTCQRDPQTGAFTVCSAG